MSGGARPLAAVVPNTSAASSAVQSELTEPPVIVGDEPAEDDPYAQGGSDFDGPDGGGGGDGRRRFGTRRLALAVVVGLLLGVAGGLLIPRLTLPGETSVDAGFARDMSTHHAQAVELAMLAAQRATDPDVRSLGADIALTQQAQIGMMQTWLTEWGHGPSSSQPRMAWMSAGGGHIRDGLMPGMATDAERAQLRAAAAQEFDLLFLRLMVNHHLGGIHMAQEAERRASEEQVRWLAATMVTAQQREITAIQQLEDNLGAK